MIFDRNEGTYKALPPGQRPISHLEVTVPVCRFTNITASLVTMHLRH
jgi:hypothetical protein